MAMRLCTRPAIPSRSCINSRSGAATRYAARTERLNALLLLHARLRRVRSGSGWCGLLRLRRRLHGLLRRRAAGKGCAILMRLRLVVGSVACHAQEQVLLRLRGAV